MRAFQALVLVVLCGSPALAPHPAQAAPTTNDPALDAPSTSQTVDQPTPDFAPRTAFAVRMQLPFAGLAYGGLTVTNGSVAARFADLVETEIGANKTVNLCESGSSWFARAGISPSVLNAKAQGTHWNLRIPVLVSFFDYSGIGGGCDDNPGHDYYGYQVSTGLDATYWGRGHFGFNMRLLGGAGGGYEKEIGPHAGKRAEWSSVSIGSGISGNVIPEILFSVGLALK
jgi:hypothetical protein